MAKFRLVLETTIEIELEVEAESKEEVKRKWLEDYDGNDLLDLARNEVEDEAEFLATREFKIKEIEEIK